MPTRLSPTARPNLVVPTPFQPVLCSRSFQRACVQLLQEEEAAGERVDQARVRHQAHVREAPAPSAGVPRAARRRRSHVLAADGDASEGEEEAGGSSHPGFRFQGEGQAEDGEAEATGGEVPHPPPHTRFARRAPFPQLSSLHPSVPDVPLFRT
jgi:hypothetical protein